MKRISVSMSVAALLVAMAPAHADLISNGSFESASDGTSLPTGNGTELSAGSTAVAGWTVIGTNTITWFDNANTDSVSTPYGNYFLDLTGATDQSPFGGVEQTLATAVGAEYALTFDVGVNQTNSWESGPVSVTASAGATTGTLSANPAGAGNIWTDETFDFAATSTSTVLSIEGLSARDDIGLDNVSVVEVASPVPEPATLLSFAPALLGFAVVRRRRRG